MLETFWRIGGERFRPLVQDLFEACEFVAQIDMAVVAKGGRSRRALELVCGIAGLCLTIGRLNVPRGLAKECAIAHDCCRPIRQVCLILGPEREAVLEGETLTRATQAAIESAGV